MLQPDETQCSVEATTHYRVDGLSVDMNRQPFEMLTRHLHMFQATCLHNGSVQIVLRAVLSKAEAALNCLAFTWGTYEQDWECT